jgi:hypothetical protein
MLRPLFHWKTALGPIVWVEPKAVLDGSEEVKVYFKRSRNRASLMRILYNQRDATYIMLFIIINALHVSGGPSAHHQEPIKLYVQPWVLNSSNPSTPAVDSRKA